MSYEPDDIAAMDDVLKSIENRAKIARFLIDEAGPMDCLPTLLEDNFEDCQVLIDHYCIVRIGTPN